MNKHSKTLTGRFHPLSAPDFLPLPQLRTLQLQRLTAIVQRAYDRVALFRKRMDERSLTPQALRALEDIALLPFAEKTDLRDTYPFGLFASPMKDIVRLHASSGTTGKPIVVAYTQEDVQVWTNVMLRAFAACGLHEGDVIQNAYGYGLFTGGLGAHYDAEALGATVIPISGDAGPAYTLECSTNLVDWEAACTTNPPVLPFCWTDGSVSNSSMRFYRVRLDP
jgi:phenylacetate-CoA ligase